MKKNTKRILTSSLIAAFALTTAFSVSTLLKPQAADFSDFTMNTGAGVRMDAPTGIRFTANVGESTKASLANATDVTFGMLIAPTLGEDGELTLEDVTDATVNAANLVTQVWTDDNQTAYNGAIVGKVDGADFPTDKYGTSLNARGYVTYTLDNVTTTEYTTNTATRSLAQAAANSLANGVADPNDFLKGILTTVGATVETEATLDMVVGGKETLAVTTSPADCGVIWASDNEQVVTVENGVVTAVAKGTTTVTATLGNAVATTTVTVGDYVQKDGSEIVYTTTDGAVGNYGLYSDAVGRRTGVYSYTSTSAAEWTHKLNVKVGGHLNSDLGPARAAALRDFKNRGYNYVAFDIYFTSGSYASISSLINATSYETAASAPSEKLQVGSAITEKNSNISVYNLNVPISGETKIEADVWYTVIVDYSQIDVDVFADKAGVYSRIEIGGIYGTIYLDNVRYYGEKNPTSDLPEYVAYDGSELVWGAHTSENFTYEQMPAGETVGDRTGVYKWNVTGSNGWNDKLMVYESGHSLLTNGNLQTTFPFASATAAYNNLNGKYNYVTIDVYFETGAVLRTCAPETSSTADQRDTFKVGSVPTELKNDCIQLYDGSTAVGATDTIVANKWYTIVVDYASGKLVSWAAIFFSGQGVMYFDNVRYYNVNPFAA